MVPLLIVSISTPDRIRYTLLFASLDCGDRYSDVFAHDPVNNWDILALDVVDDYFSNLGTCISVPEEEKITSLESWLH